ncbi:MAG: ABC transporter ATP-binding protein [Spirochaetaceae bacterium]|nr:ABC transporter ATP-binding protein [Spirochaetaceae bacterium]
MKTKRSTLINNIFFMLKEHLAFDKVFVVLLAIHPGITVLASLTSLYLSKVVLNSLSVNKELFVLLLEVLVFSVGLILFSVADKMIDIKLDEKSWKFFFYYGYKKLNTKRMNLDYELYTSHEGKTLSQKALTAVGNYAFSSIVALLVNSKNVVTNLLGLIAFSGILITLHPLVVVLLVSAYIIDGMIIIFIEWLKAKFHTDEAEINIKKRCVSKKLTLLEYAKDIRIYSLHRLIIRISKSIMNDEIQLTKKKEGFSLLQNILQGLLTFLRDGIAYFYLIHVTVTNPEMTIGSFALYLGAIAGFGDWLSQVVENIQEVFESNEYVSDFREFMELEGTEKIITQNNFTENSHTIKLENVSYAYSGSEDCVLKDINLEIKANEKLGIVGLNGSGKSTLIKLITGLLQPTTGKVLIDGIDISTVEPEKVFSLFSTVFQESSLIPSTVFNNVSFSHVVNGQNEAKVIDTLNKIDALNFVNTLPKGIHTNVLAEFYKDAVSFSGGQTNKIIMARSLYKDRNVLILDEPTKNLDPIAEANVYKTYAQLASGKTAILISHRLKSTRICDRIIVLKDGYLIEQGTHEELLDNAGWYKELYDLSTKYYEE